MCLWLFITVLFVTAKDWKPLRCLPIREIVEYIMVLIEYIIWYIYTKQNHITQFCPWIRLYKQHNSITTSTTNIQIMVFKYHFPLKEPRHEVRKVQNQSEKQSKTTRAMSKGLRSQCEWVHIGLRLIKNTWAPIMTTTSMDYNSQNTFKSPDS